ncbi:MAG: hypothetical protein ACI9CZ_000772 [Flavobacterium sp.]|jgi:hypothetical protein
MLNLKTIGYCNNNKTPQKDVFNIIKIYTTKRGFKYLSHLINLKHFHLFPCFSILKVGF